MARVGDLFQRSALRRGGEQIARHLLSPLAAALYTPDGDLEEQIAIPASTFDTGGEPISVPIATWFDNRPALHVDPLTVTGAGVTLPAGVYDCAVTIFADTSPVVGAIWFEPTLNGDVQVAAGRLVGPFDHRPQIGAGDFHSPTSPQVILRIAVEEGEVLGGDITTFDSAENHVIALMAIIKVA